MSDMNKHNAKQDLSADSAEPAAAPDMSKLNGKERAVLQEYMDDNHLSLTPHDHSDNVVKSSGEKIFNAVTYKGIGWLTNAAISIYLTELFMHGKGKQVMHDTINHLTPFYKKFLNSPSKASEYAKATVMFAGLSSGGFALLYPIKKLEEYKPQVVEYLDETYNHYFTPSKVDLEIQDRAHERLREDPAPSWGNIMLGRVLGIGAVFSSMVLIARGRDAKVAAAVAENAPEMLKKAGSKSGIATLSKLGERLGNSTRGQNMLGLTMMELYTSLLAEEVLHLTTKTYKRMKRQDLLESAMNDNENIALRGGETPPAVITNSSDHPAQASASSWQDRVDAPKPHRDKILDFKSAERPLGMGV